MAGSDFHKKVRLSNLNEQLKVLERSEKVLAASITEKTLIVADLDERIVSKQNEMSQHVIKLAQLREGEATTLLSLNAARDKMKEEMREHDDYINHSLAVLKTAEEDSASKEADTHKRVSDLRGTVESLELSVDNLKEVARVLGANITQLHVETSKAKEELSTITDQVEQQRQRMLDELANHAALMTVKNREIDEADNYARIKRKEAEDALADAATARHKTAEERKRLQHDQVVWRREKERMK